MTVILTLAFAPFRVFKSTMDQVYATMVGNYKHYVLNQHYPVDKNNNWNLIIEYCKQKNIQLFDAGANLGLAGGYNYLIKKANVGNDDYVILIDPDVFPVTPGWDAALNAVLQDKSVGWASLNHHNHHPELKPHSRTVINNINVLITHTGDVNSICGISGHFLTKLPQGLQEPKHYYGHLESIVFKQLQCLRYNWVYLTDFKEVDNRIGSDLSYTAYKIAYAHHNSTNLCFEDWRNDLLSTNSFYQYIHGWFDYQDIYETVVRLTDDKPAHFVEIGAWLGKSACFMATEIKLKKKNIKFDVVDTWPDDTNPAAWGAEDIVTKYGSFYNAFLSHMKEADIEQYVNPIRMNIVEASKLYADNSLDFIFIDGSHYYDDVKADILAWLPKLKRFTDFDHLPIIAGHDYNSAWPDVMKAVKEIFGEKFVVINNCWRGIP